MIRIFEVAQDQAAQMAEGSVKSAKGRELAVYINQP